MLKFLREKLKESDKIAEEIVRVQEFAAARSPDERIAYIADLAVKWPETVAAIKDYDELNEIAEIFEFYELVGGYFREIEECVDLLSGGDFVEESQNLKHLYVKFQQKYRDDAQFTEALAKIILDQCEGTNLDDKIEELRESYGTDSVELYVEVISSLIAGLRTAGTALSKTTKLVPEERAALSKTTKLVPEERAAALSLDLRELLNADKDDALGAAVIKKKEPKSAKLKHNPSLSRFGLIPVTEPMNLKELVCTALRKDVRGSITTKNLEALAKSNKAVFIIQNKITHTPIEYDITKLFQSEYEQPSAFGLTSKFLNKMNTIQVLPKAKWNFSIDVYGRASDKDIVNYYAFSTIDGQRYCGLAAKFGAQNLALSYSKVRSMLSAGVSMRPQNYHAVCAKIAAPHMFLAHKMPIDAAREESRTIDSGLIRNEIYEELIKFYNSNAKKIKSEDDFVIFFQNEKIEEIFVKTLLQLYAMLQGDDFAYEQKAEFQPSELIISYITELRTISQRFVRELQQGYERDPLKGEPSADEKRKKFEELVKASLEHSISLKSNIYQSLSFKNMLLSYN